MFSLQIPLFADCTTHNMGNAEAEKSYRRRQETGSDSDTEEDAKVLEHVIDNMHIDLLKLMGFRTMITLFIGASVYWIAVRLYGTFKTRFSPAPWPPLGPWASCFGLLSVL